MRKEGKEVWVQTEGAKWSWQSAAKIFSTPWSVLAPPQMYDYMFNIIFVSNENFKQLST